MASNMKVSKETSFLWTPKVPYDNCWYPGNHGTLSAGRTPCFLQTYHSANEPTYALTLSTQRSPPPPFQVTSYLSKGTDLFLPQTKKIKGHVSDFCIWNSTHSEMSKVCPGILQEKTVSFKVIVHSVHSVQVTTDHKSVQTTTHLDPNFLLEKLSVDFAKLLTGDDANSDVEVSCGDITWKVHRNMLSCRSEVFRAMLQSDMLESKRGRVEVKDTEPGLFGQFLEHLYTGRLPELTVDTAMRFYEIGDKYSVAGVKESCASFLTDSLKPDNACSILSLADAHGDQAFKDSVVSYMVSEKIPLHKEHWSDFRKDHPQLAFEVYDQFLQLHVSK